MSKKKTNCLKLPACPPLAACGNKFLFSCIAGFCSGFSYSLAFLVLLYQDKRTRKEPLRLLQWNITKTTNTDTAAAFTDTVTYTITVCNNSVNTQTGILADNIPANFVITNSTLPATVTLNSMECDTFTISGYFTTQGSCFYNVASVTSPIGTTWKDSVCVTVINVCNVPNAQQIADSSFSLPMSASYSNVSFVLHGRFYVNDTLILTNCSVYAYPGAQIIVLPTGLLTLDGTTIEGCTQMWRGVRLNKNAKIIMRENSSIMDADTGITALHGAAFDLRFSSVINCVVGIAVPKQSGINNVQGYVNGCKFGLYAAAFKPDYTGQNAHHAIPRSCIEINDVVMTIGDKDTNEFRNSNWGVYAMRSDLTIKTCRFRNMVAAGSLYGTATHKGTAVVAESKSAATAGMITFTNSSIDSCVYGTYAEWTTARVYSINAAHVAAVGSYHLYCNSTGMSTTVNNCNITAGKAGITFQNSERGTMTAAGNAIKVTAGGSSVGINIISTTTNFGNYQIMNNPYIEAVNGSGIVANSAKNANVINNFVKLSGNTTNGISLTGCDSSTVSCNTVSGRYPAVSYQNRGINVSHSTNNYMNCNNTDSTYLGNYFAGVCTGTKFRGTQMHNHFEGLRLFTNAVIDTQAHAGNLWFGPFTTGGYGANNLNNSLPGLQASQFFIDFSYGGAYIPSIPLNNTGWIINQAGTEFDCTGLLLCTDETHERNVGTQLQLTIAEDSLESTEFLDETKIMAKNYLYKDVKENDSLINVNPVISSFVTAQEKKSIGYLYETNKLIIQSDEWHNTDLNNLMLADSLIKLVTDSIKTLDSLAAIDSTLNNILSRESLTYQLQTLLQNKGNSVGQHEATAVPLLAQAHTKNTTVIPEGQPEEHDKYMYDIEILYHIGGLNDIVNYLGSIEAIARQCPHAGGKAVYKARSYMYLINDTIIYDDETVCFQAGYRRGKIEKDAKEETLNDVQIIPNPANDKVEIMLNGISDGVCKIQIRSVLNKIVYDEVFDCKKQKHIMNVSNLSLGVYYVTVNVASKKSVTSKLIIVR